MWRALIPTTAVIISLLVGAPVGAAQPTAELSAARLSLQSGDYDAAIDAYRAILSAEEPGAETSRAATLGLSAALQARGLIDLSADVVRDRLQRVPDDADLLARQAELQLLRGEFAAAEQTAATALQQNDEQLLARLVQAHVFTQTGRLDEALEGYRWFVRYYNRAQPTDAEALLLVAEGSLQYARWKSVSDIFNFVVNTLCPDALQDDSHCWQAAHLSGSVLLEKYNRPQAVQELEAALDINSRAAEVFVSLGEAALQDDELEQAIDFAQQALDINPRLPAGLQLAADVSLLSGDTRAGAKFITQARAVNPHDQRTLAQQAALILLEDGVPDENWWRTAFTENTQLAQPPDGQPGNTSRFVQLWRELIERNPRPGQFLTQLGDMLDGFRKYAAAEVCYRRAIELMPQLANPRTKLGMLLMRTGHLDEAATILDEAFRADPFHVRVSNMRKVLRQLDRYAVISSDHFVIRVPEEERILGEEMSHYLEGTYNELTGLFGYEPPVRAQFEVYGAAAGQSAHQWFSARMVGLPWVQTVGASTGMIVAMASPYDQPQPFNWARVARHEFVHILTLQQTEFNIPHWYTEALAVRTEAAIPESWDTLLLRRVPAGDMFTLDDINRGFIRPDDPTDWNMAYCQSWLYAQYIAERFGEDALIRLLDIFRRGTSTNEAIEKACTVHIDQFEQGYAEYVEEYVDEIRRTRVTPPLELETAAARWKENPADHEAGAQLAWSLWQAGGRQPALELAEQVHVKAPTQPLVVAILAEGEFEAGNLDEAAALLQTVFDPDDPHPAILERMARVHAANEDWAAARDLWDQGVSRWSREPAFLRGLAATLLRLDDDHRLREVLITLAERDADDGIVRKKLAHMAAAREDWTAVIRWAREALHCDVYDASIHRLLADAYEHTGETTAAARHTELAERIANRE